MLYIHCAAHNLNLVLNDACQHITAIKEFYDVVQRLYVFFSQSIKRWEMLENQLSKPTLKRLCPTRWTSRADAIHALRFRYADILKALTKIALQSKKAEERTEASGLIKSIETFEFVMMLVFQERVLENVKVVSQVLQKKDVDLLQAATLLENTCNNLSLLRDQFDNIKSTAQGLAASWGISCHFTQKRARIVKRHFDEIAEDERLTDPEKMFKVGVFYACIDTAVSQLKQRFKGLNTIAKRFRFLRPSELVHATDDELRACAETFAVTFDDDISSEFPSQLLSFRSALRSEIKKT